MIDETTASWYPRQWAVQNWWATEPNGQGFSCRLIANSHLTGWCYILPYFLRSKNKGKPLKKGRAAVLSLGESQERELLVGIALTGKTVLDFWTESRFLVGLVFFPLLVCWGSRAVYLFFFFPPVNEQNCTKETLDFSQLVFFPLGSNWAS